MAEETKEQPKLTVRDLFSQQSLEVLLITAKFGNVLTTPEDVTLHNDRMLLLQDIVGRGESKDMTKFVKEVARTAFNI